MISTLFGGLLQFNFETLKNLSTSTRNVVMILNKPCKSWELWLINCVVTKLLQVGTMKHKEEIQGPCS